MPNADRAVAADPTAAPIIQEGELIDPNDLYAAARRGTIPRKPLRRPMPTFMTAFQPTNSLPGRRIMSGRSSGTSVM
jgi:hypothetical protein